MATKKKGKDPAFLFYPGDWTLGTITLSRIQKGAYLDVLIAQFSNGPLTIEQIKTILGSDFSHWPAISGKFEKDSEGRFYNQRLVTEIESRRSYVESRRKNLQGNEESEKKPYGSPYGATYEDKKRLHMENENIIENEEEFLEGGLGETYGINDQKKYDDPGQLMDPATEFQHQFQIILKNSGIPLEKSKFVWDQFRNKRIMEGTPMNRKQHIAALSKFCGWFQQNQRNSSDVSSKRQKLKDALNG